MRIGFDAKRAAQNATGLGNYSRFVIGSLLDLAPGNDYLLYVPSPSKNRFIGALPPAARMVSPRGVWRACPSLWRVMGMSADLRRDGIDLFHGLSNELPSGITGVRGMRSIVTIHDLIFLRYPSYYKAIDRRIYDRKFRRACIDSDRIIAVSECTKRDIMSYYGIDGAKIDVVYQGCDPAFALDVPADVKAAVARRYGLPQQYILYVGSIEERKNLMLLVEAAAMARTRCPVVAVGRRTPYADQVVSWAERHGMAGRLMMLHGVPSPDLPAIYRMASLFVYPSRFEGFGIPLLEALNAGVPVIGATGSCLEEAGGESSLYVSPDDPAALAEAIDRVLGDEALRGMMIARGHDHAARFTRERLLGDLLKTYEKVLNT